MVEDTLEQLNDFLNDPTPYMERQKEDIKKLFDAILNTAPLFNELRQFCKENICPATNLNMEQAIILTATLLASLKAVGSINIRSLNWEGGDNEICYI